MLASMQKLAAFALTGTMMMVPYGGGCQTGYDYLDGFVSDPGSSWGFDFGYGAYDEPYYYDDYYYDDVYYDGGYYYDDCYSCYDDYWYY